MKQTSEQMQLAINKWQTSGCHVRGVTVLVNGDLCGAISMILWFFEDQSSKANKSVYLQENCSQKSGEQTGESGIRPLLRY